MAIFYTNHTKFRLFAAIFYIIGEYIPERGISIGVCCSTWYNHRYICWNSRKCSTCYYRRNLFLHNYLLQICLVCKGIINNRVNVFANR